MSSIDIRKISITNLDVDAIVNAANSSLLMGGGDGRDGTISGFVTLNEDDCTKIYQAMI